MATDTRQSPFGSTSDDLDQDALIRQLGGTSTTMPVSPPVSAAAVDPRDPTRTSANAPRVQQNAQGQWQLTEHGNTRNLQGNEVADATNYANQFWKDNPTGWQANNPSTMGDIYKQVLGRDPDAEGLAAHAKNPGGFGGAVDTILNSPEATARRTAPPATGGASTTTPGATTGAAAGAVAPFTGVTPKHAFEGFDFSREQNPQKSAKDAFAYLANQAPPPPLNDKAALGAWFTQYIEPGMNQYGHKVTSVDGDKFGFENWQGKFNVDYGRGAGAQGGALAWQVDDPTAKLSNGAYTPAAATSPSPLTGVAQPTADELSAQDRIRKEIDALIAGGASPIENDALLAALR